MDENEIFENYEQLRVSRGWSYDTLADDLEPRDKKLAAHFRAKASAATPDGRTAAPKGRKASAKQTADAASAEEV